MIYNENLNVLERQVYDLSKAVQAHWTKDEIIAEFGIKIVGRLENMDLPPISTDEPPPGGAEAYGEAYAVGLQAPYEIVIWTRPDPYHPTAYWFNIGPIAVEGPEGATIDSAAINANYQIVLTMSDGRTITATGTSLRGPKGDKGDKGDQGIQGIQGIRGIQGPQGNQGDQGPEGPAGPPGYFNIIGAFSNNSQRPDPATVEAGSAYLLWHAVEGEENGGHYDLYVLITRDGVADWQLTGRVSAGTYIFQNGQPVNTFNADTKLDAYTSSGGGNKVYGVNNDGDQKMYTVRNDPQTGNSGTYKNQIVQYDVANNKNTGLIRIAETPLQEYHTASKAYVDGKVYNSKVLQSCIATFGNQGYISYYRSVNRNEVGYPYDGIVNFDWQACSGALYPSGDPIYAFQNLGWSSEDDSYITYIRYFDRENQIVNETTFYGNPENFEILTLN